MNQSFLKYSTLVLTVLLSMGAFAQKSEVKNLKGFDQRKMHFGFSLGYNNSSFRLDVNDAFDPTIDSILSIFPDKRSGFALGIISDLHLSPTVHLRFLPNLSFEERVVKYTFLEQDGTTPEVLQNVEGTYLHLPLNIKFRTERIRNFAAFAVAGGQYSIDFASNEDVDNSVNALEDVVILTDRTDFSYQLGGGFDFFLPYFKFGIELKMNFGIPNVLIQDNTIFSTHLDQLRTRSFMITLNFEG